MKSLAIVSLAVSLVSAVSAAPLTRRTTPPIDDIFILQYALGLENLENAFYHEGLEEFNDQAFSGVGFPDFVRGRTSQIAEHEATHVATLTKTLESLGKSPVKPCTYEFNFTDAYHFMDTAGLLELVGDAAYLGAAPFVSSKEILFAAGTIYGTEAHHVSWIDSAVGKQSAWSGPFDYGLDPRQVFSLASLFIKSCPPDNFDLGLVPFPALSVSPAKPLPGSQVEIEYCNGGKCEGEVFLALKTGFGEYYVNIENGSANIPGNILLQGHVVYLITTAKDTSDNSTLAGPTIVDYDFDSHASNTAPS